GRADHDEEDRRGGRHRCQRRFRDLAPRSFASFLPQAQQYRAESGGGSRLGGGEDAGEHATEEHDEDDGEAPDSGQGGETVTPRGPSPIGGADAAADESRGDEADGEDEDGEADRQQEAGQ